MSAAPAGESVFVECRGVIDGSGAGLRRGVGVLVRDGLVEALPAPQELGSSPLRRLDYGECVAVPGFIDSHTHITIRPGEGDQHGQLRRPAVWQALRGVANLRRMLCSGVTTARIMTELHDIDFEFKELVARGEVHGPELFVSGPGLSPPGGHGSAGGGVSGEANLRATVRRLAAQGADHIKMFTTGGVSSTDSTLEHSNYSAEEIAATVEEAAACGLGVSAHAHGGPGAELAVDNGIRSIEHGALLSRQIIGKMVERSTWLVLTNTILYHPTGIEQGDAASPAIMAKVLEARGGAELTLAAVRQAGVRVAVGTDSMHGLIGFEMEWMVRHGWSELEAISAATAAGAELIGAPDRGTLEPGKRADLVLLRRNPLEDITAVYDVAGVVRAGQLVVDERGATRGVAT